MDNFETRYNINHVVKVFVKDAKVYTFYKYKKQIKRFGITFRKEGVYWCFLHEERLEKMPSNLFVKDEIVYEKPCVVINFIDNSQKVIYFDTFEQATQWCKNQTWLLESHFKPLSK